MTTVSLGARPLPTAVTVLPAPAPAPALDVEYVLPLRRSEGDRDDVAELAGYLRSLVEVVDVTVVDGSGPEARARHRAAFPSAVRVLAPDGPTTRNGKVRGVLTGVRAARHDRVVLADDDVRHTPGTLAAITALLENADVVRPQNVFRPLTWHARWDTARSLVGRAVGGDWPGTLGVRRDLLLATGGYDGDVLFENLELVRTVRAAGGVERRAHHVFVTRVPPTTRHFAGQRVRQAYDDLAQPARLAAEAAVLPVVLLASRRRAVLLGVAGLVVALAETGRRRASGRTAFPATSALWAPLWAAERAVCVWLALGWWLLGGVPYAGRRLRRAATPSPVLRRRLAPIRDQRRRTGGAVDRPDDEGDA